MAAFRSVVTDVQQKAGRDFALDVEIPELHITKRVVLINSKVVGDRSRVAGWKTILQRDRDEESRVRLGDSERRLKCQLLHHGSVLREVVIDSIAGANHRVLKRLPCHTDARSKIIAIGLD